MIKFIRNFRLLKLLNESSETLSVFEKMAARLDKLNERLFKEKVKRNLKIEQIMLEIEMINAETSKNKKVTDKINKFLND
jgi:hypothetical protein